MGVVARSHTLPNSTRRSSRRGPHVARRFRALCFANASVRMLASGTGRAEREMRWADDDLSTGTAPPLR